MIRIDKYRVEVPSDLEYELDGAMQDDGLRADFEYLAKTDELKLRFAVADLLGVDVRHVRLREVQL